jgi:DegV family protein with EDD domain
MPQLCILTDKTVYFDHPIFVGSENVFIISPTSEIGFVSFNHFAHSLGKANKLKENIIASIDLFKKIFTNLSHVYNEIVVILCSPQICLAMYENAFKASESLQGRISIQIIDSQSISAGLGQVVMRAASIASGQPSTTEVYRQLQNKIAHIYTIFCSKDLKNLAKYGQFDFEHAIVGEMLGIAPVMILESGQIVATQKARNARHLVELLLEFVEEFYKLEKIFIFQSNPVFGSEFSQLQERLDTTLPNITASGITANPMLKELLGNRHIGLIAMDIDI